MLTLNMFESYEKTIEKRIERKRNNVALNAKDKLIEEYKDKYEEYLKKYEETERKLEKKTRDFNML